MLGRRGFNLALVFLYAGTVLYAEITLLNVFMGFQLF